MTTGDREELLSLLSAFCDGVLSDDALPRLETLASTPEGRALYLAYLELHGTLIWDAAHGTSTGPLTLESEPARTRPEFVRHDARSSGRASWIAGGAVVAALAALVLITLIGTRSTPIDSPEKPQLATIDSPGKPPAVPDNPPSSMANERGPRLPIQLNGAPQPETNVSRQEMPGAAQPTESPKSDLFDETRWPAMEVVSRINSELQEGWRSAGVTPSVRADDGAWLRRVSLDLAGRVPHLAELDAFLTDRQPDKRDRVLHKLLNSPDHYRHLATVWGALLIGRHSPESVDREAFLKFLRMSFAENRPWNEVVGRMLAAEGRSDEQGESNFLIAHLNNQAVPATAFTSRVFLGIQLQCVQCHKHPEHGQAQIAFWEFNSFFKQTHSRPVIDRTNGGARQVATELYNDASGGPNFYETRQGVMQVAFPKFAGAAISAEAGVNRRSELARLMTEGRQPLLAAAFVNRTWDRFFGYSLTRVVDDMGPHSPSSHPELLAGLTNAFIDSGYNVRELERWICQCEAYQLSSVPNSTNRSDDPSTGEPPLFSRSYLRLLSVEQLCDSLLTVTQAHRSVSGDWEIAEQHRQKWLSEFVHSLETDENDEANTLAGLQQALLLMNGELVDQALEDVPGTFLHDVIHQPGNDIERIRRLCRAVLCREPTPRELSAFRKLMRSGLAAKSGAEPYQDLLWALLNSNEFAAVR